MTSPRAGRPQPVLLSQAATVPHSANALNTRVCVLEERCSTRVFTVRGFAAAVFEEIMAILHKVIVRRTFKLKIQIYICIHMYPVLAT